MNSRVIFFIAFFAVSQVSLAQINTERYRKDYERQGLMYSNSFGFNFATGNSSYLELGNRLRIDYNDTLQDYFAIADYNYRVSNGSKSSNKGFIHLRTIKDFEEQKFMMIEGFTQVQFDEFLLLRYRMLIGGGFRLDPVALIDSSALQTSMLKVFFGTGIFYEFEQYSTSPQQSSSLIRWSNYLSFVWSLNQKVDLNMMHYLQPAPEDFSNYRYALNLAMNTKLTGKLYYELRIEYLYRSVVFGAKKSGDLDVKNTLRLTF